MVVNFGRNPNFIAHAFPKDHTIPFVKAQGEHQKVVYKERKKRFKATGNGGIIPTKPHVF